MVDHKFLQPFEKKHWGFITNLFLRAIRTGIDNEMSAIEWVREDLNYRKDFSLLCSSRTNL